MKKLALLAAALVLCATLFLNGCGGGGSDEPANAVGDKPAAAGAPAGPAEEGAGPGEGLERIVLGGGCFWCLEAVMELVDGVTSVTSGYAGGDSADPTYEDVCTGDTGHAEVVAVDYDPTAVSLEGLLDVFFATHDPTTVDRQGADTGSQYRSIILYGSDAQGAAVGAYLDEARGDFDDPVVTEVEALERFYPAEEYHQDYYARNPDRPYCSTVISPKVEKALEMLESE